MYPMLLEEHAIALWKYVISNFSMGIYEILEFHLMQSCYFEGFAI